MIAVHGNKELPQLKLSFSALLKIVNTGSFEFLCKLSDKPVSQFKLGWQKAIFVNHPEIAEHVLKDSVTNYPKDNFYHLIESIIGKNILTTNDLDYWGEHRKLMSGLFHQNSIHTMFADINQTAQHYVNSLQQQKRVNINEFCTEMTLELITKLMFGSHINKEVIHQLATHIDYFTQALVTQHKLGGLPFIQKMSPNFNRHLKAFNDSMLSILSTYQESGTDNLLTRMQDHIEQQDRFFSTEQLLSEAALILFAGHETTATALMWALITLSQFPQVREELKAEIQAVCNGESLTIDNLIEMPFLDQVVKEILRLYPPFPAVPRICREDESVGGYTIPAKAKVIVNIAGIHRNPEFWDDPQLFNPRRFAKKIAHKYAYIPFLNGPRICIGLNLAMLELKAMLVNLLQQFDLDLLPGQIAKPKHVISLQTQSPVYMSITSLV